MDVSIVSAERELWKGDADMVVARSPEGEFAILRGHTPFLASLVPGRVSIVTATDREEFFVSGGFLEASGPADDYHVIVLADDAEPLGDIDPAEARRRAEDARARMDQEADESAEVDLRVAMARAEMASGEYSSR